MSTRKRARCLHNTKKDKNPWFIFTDRVLKGHSGLLQLGSYCHSFYCHLYLLSIVLTKLMWPHHYNSEKPSQTDNQTGGD